LEELGEIRGMSISKTTTAKSWTETKSLSILVKILQYYSWLRSTRKKSMS